MRTRYTLVAIKTVALCCVASSLVCCMTNENTTDAFGSESRYNVIDGYASARQFAGPQAELLFLEAQSVESDGTLNLHADYGTVPKAFYYFVRPNQKRRDPVQENAPIGSQKRTTTLAPYEKITVEITKPHTVRVSQSGREFTEKWRSMRRSPVGAPIFELSKKPALLEAPKCSFASLWRQAIKSGVPENAVAMIRYDHQGYHFKINGTPLDLLFTPQCQLVKKKKKAVSP